MVFITAKEIFTAVRRKNNISQNEFCEKLNFVTNELCEMYSDMYVFKNKAFLPTEDVFSGLDVYDEYKSACIHGVLAFLTGDEKEYSLYLRNADKAYHSVWRKLSKGKAFGIKRSWF